ncbi:DAR GTPase 2, mitochondrial [Aristolochia californica]|uniref:DAR GTPase 2, mitochondrial n=1 Tax=Aristolochia californica TaxID=171875 RepID=UPI0035E06D73
MAVTATFAGRVGSAVQEAATKKGGGWFGHHMAAASQAILDRIPLVDLVVEIRDSRIPFSSAYKYQGRHPSPSKHVIVLNKTDLANRYQTQKWVKFFDSQNCGCYGLNSHNKDNVKELLKFLQTQLRELKACQSNYTATIMLVGIPNVGKSAIVNSLHQIGRVSAAEKGKLKHATVNPSPGETKDISSYKIASHPNVYVLDTPGVLTPQILDVEVASKLVLTGAISDSVVGEIELARYFLAILNSSDAYKRWEKLISEEDDMLFTDPKQKLLNNSNASKPQKRQYRTDHTQDFIVKDVRRTFFETISSLNGNLQNEKEMVGLIETQFVALHEALRVPSYTGEDGYKRVAIKLINLCRTGRLGCYTLDPVPVYDQEVTT